MKLLRHRRRGQTIVTLALLLGVLMTFGALVLDVGNAQRVRSETQNACDAAALAGITTLAVTGDPNAARTRAIQTCARNGVVVGQDGVISITARAFPNSCWPAESAAMVDTISSDRYEVSVQRQVPQYIAAIFGAKFANSDRTAVAALMTSVPMDVQFDDVGFPERANLAQFGPDAPYNYGDPYSTRQNAAGQPNPLYTPMGYQYDVYVPPGLKAATGSSLVRVEIFDPDTINKGNHVTKNPSQLVDQNNDPTEPEAGGLDEIRQHGPAGGEGTTAATFAGDSTQTEFVLLDGANQIIASASYGPQSNTPFWYHHENPGSVAAHQASHADPAQAQIATDLHWITPQGFQFDSEVKKGPYRLRVRTLHGSSENGYSLRIGMKRANGVKYDQLTHGIVNQEAFGIFATGRLPINFRTGGDTTIPIASIPAGSGGVTVSNFDTDVGTTHLRYSLYGFDATKGQGKYPILFPAPPGASGANVVTSSDGAKWCTDLNGTLSSNGTFASDELSMPATVMVPKTDGNGNLWFNSSGKVVFIDSRPFEGADLLISYGAGAQDTSVWETGLTDPAPGAQQILLIR